MNPAQQTSSTPSIGIVMLIDALESKLDEKYCPKCGFVMSRRLDFGKDSRSKDGLCRYCKDCIAEYAEATYEET